MLIACNQLRVGEERAVGWIQIVSRLPFEDRDQLYVYVAAEKGIIGIAQLMSDVRAALVRHARQCVAACCVLLYVRLQRLTYK